ncbi:MAG: aspartate carbamoyltransferase [Candidatus Berkelbacteria bacterium]|nr:aspartate carbamoyltransferase [Candidatus Berkelbacteria bacterium]
MAASLVGRKLLSVEDLDPDQTREVLDLAHEYHMKFVVPQLTRPRRLDILTGLDMIGLFYEPSSRTALSFRRAAMNLGMDAAIVFEAAEQTSKAKGESDADTGRIVSPYTDFLVVRSPVVEAVREIALASNIPFVNAGNGDDEHPTQGWLDQLTLERELKTRDFNGLKIAFLGDPRFARSIHSLAKLLALHYEGVEMTFVAPEKLWPQEELCQWLSTRCRFKGCVADLKAGLEGVDVAYITRIQAERFRDSQPDLFEQLQAERPKFRVNNTLIEQVNPDVLLMHPLPRVDELDPDVDTRKKAAYFRQAANGVPLRMALIHRLLQDD